MGVYGGMSPFMNHPFYELPLAQVLARAASEAGQLKLRLQDGSSLLHRQAAKALLLLCNESGLGRADGPAQ
jgi:hypothetical protein